MTCYDKRVQASAVGLSALASYVDAVGFIQLGGFFVSFMSGNSTHLGVGLIERSHDAAVAGGLIALFFTGVTAGSLVGRLAKTHRRPVVLMRLADDVRTAAYRIIDGKGYTSFGVATAIVRICEAVLRNERIVLPVSTLLTGEFGLSDVYLSLPCILGAGGVERVLLPELDDNEIAQLRTSGQKIQMALAGLNSR